MVTTAKKYKEISNKKPLNSYWTTVDFELPLDPLQCLEYYEQVGEWPFIIPPKWPDAADQFYSVVTSFQKHHKPAPGMEVSPPELADFVASKVELSASKYIKIGEVFKSDLAIVDVGCGYGSLSWGLLKRGFMVSCVDVNYSMIECCKLLIGDHFGVLSLECENVKFYSPGGYVHFVVSRPATHGNLFIEFLESTAFWTPPGSTMFAVLPSGLAYRVSPKRLSDALFPWNVINSWPIDKTISGTSQKLELVEFLRK